VISYRTPGAFRRALTDRLRTLAAPHGPWPLASLLRQFGYDRLLARLYLADDGWVVKGATALLARSLAVRHTIDVDVYRAVPSRRAEQDLRSAIRVDAGDWFTVEAGPGTPVADGVAGRRFPVVARLGGVEWARFHVDVVSEGVCMTGVPDDVPPLTSVDIPDLVRPHYRAYPMQDHIADKTCAMLERHGPAQLPSTRYKDLVDLVVLTSAAQTSAEGQRKAITSEAARRGLTLPEAFALPDPELWTRGYAAEAGRAVRFVTRSVTEAMDTVRPYVDPVLNGTASGVWHPETQSWR
jgi:hypothetical protein